MNKSLRFVSIFLLSATLVGKLSLITNEHALLGVSDPLLGVFTTRQLLFLASLLEIGTMFTLLWAKEQLYSELAVAWLATVFVAYRVGLSAMGYKGPCACMGNLGEKFGVSGKSMDSISILILAVLCCIGYYCVFKRVRSTWRQ